MNEEVYGIWLQKALKYGSHKAKQILDFYKTIQEFYEAGEYGWRLCGFFNNNEIHSLKSSSIEEANSIFEICKKLGYIILTLSSKNYPKLLLDISNPPAVLYIRGDVSALNVPISLSVVGTRNATRYGMEIAYEMGYKIAKRDNIVVSGGAIGIDTAAHKGALASGGRTVAVLGCGLDFRYLLENKVLRDRIADSGALVSEYPPGYPVYPYNFPMRNRIISGLSLGTIVVEAGRKSGSLITANLANDQNRDVFVAPVDVRNTLNIGSRDLISDGARVVSNVDDIIDEYEFTLNNRISKEKIGSLRGNYTSKSEAKQTTHRKQPVCTDNSLDISKSARVIYDLIGENQMHVDNIVKLSGFKVEDLLPILTELEIYGLIKPCPGNGYRRAGN